MVDDANWISGLASVQTYPDKILLRALPRTDLEMESGTDVVEAIRQECRPLSKPADYVDVAGAVSQARIVGLGEATHGTREFALHRAALIKELILHHDFNVIALEAPWHETEAINAAITSGTLVAEDAVALQGYWPFRIVEIADLVKWLREENAKRPRHRRIEFVGVDTGQPRAIATALRASLPSLPRKLRDTAEAALRELERYSHWSEFRDADAATKDDISARFQALVNQVSRLPTRRKSAYAEVLLRGAHRLSERAKTRGYPDRDEYMAAVMVDLLAQKDRERRIVYWGHDAHVAARDFLESTPAGSYLRAHLGASYHAVGSLFYEGTFRSLSIETMKMFFQRVAPPRAHFVEAAFGSAIADGACFVPFSRVQSSALKSWLGAPRLRRHFGSQEVADDYPWTPVELSKTWDSILFVRASTPSLDLETPGEPGRGPFRKK